MLLGYLRSDLVPSAVRLGERLLQANSLSAAGRRQLAERLSPVAQGADLAARVWPPLLRAAPADIDGWTLFAEALTLCGKTEAAQRADGIGAALGGSSAAASAPVPSPVDSTPERAYPEAPDGLLPVGEPTMPRLHQTLSDALGHLGARGTAVMLDPHGGAEAFLVAPNLLVLGAGAVSLFGPAELTYLLALGLCLGSRGANLRRPGAVEGFEEAALNAFEAFPSSLAAGRVLCQLDERVRGLDPAFFSMAELLPSNPAYRAIALSVLDALATD